MKDRVPGAPGQYKALVTETELQKMHAGEQFTITMTRDDQPIVEGTPYSKAAVLPDALAQLLCPDKEDPTPADALAALLPLSGGTMTGPVNMGGNGINNANNVYCTALNNAKIERFHADADTKFFARWKADTGVYLFLTYMEGVDPCAYVVSTKFGVEGVNTHKIAGSDSSSMYIYDSTNELMFRLEPYCTCLMIHVGF